MAIRPARRKHMKKIILSVKMMFCLLCASLPALAQGPAFDCSKATGEVEQLICKDEQLSMLDRKLATIYGEALKNQATPVPAWLAAEQRDWLKGRNDCSKSADMRPCVETEYTTRIAEIQAKSKLVGSLGPVTYRCANGGDDLLATFYKTDPSTVILERGDRRILAFQGASASGAKYDGPNVMLWDKGGQAQVSWFGQEVKCTAKR